MTPLDLESFATSRGFSAQTLEKYGIRVEDGVVVIPLLGRNGHVWYEREHRPGGQPKYLSPKGVEPHLYNPLGLGPHSTEVWLAEGEFDTIALIEAGAPACGVLGANSFYSPWVHLFSGARIVLAFDPDDAGRQAADKIAGLFGQLTTVDVFDIPPPHGDINDWWKADPSGLRRAVLEF